MDVQSWFAIIPWSYCEQTTELVAELLAWHSSHHTKDAWLVEFAGAPNAWPTSFSVAASSDNMSVSDDEESRTPSSPTSLASQFMTRARHFTNQVAKSSTGETATLHRHEPHTASNGNDLGSIFMTKARQLTGQRFDMSPFSPVSSAEHSTFKLGQGGKTGNGHHASVPYHTHAHKFDLQLPKHEPATTCFLYIFQPLHQALYTNSSTLALPSCLSSNLQKLMFAVCWGRATTL